MVSPETQFQQAVNEIFDIAESIQVQSNNDSLTKGTYASTRKNFVKYYNEIMILMNANPILHNQIHYKWIEQIQNLNAAIKNCEPS